MNRTLLIALTVAFLTGCATPYQKIGTDVSGGHSFRQLSEDTFSVVFSANGFTSPSRASDFAMLRASEVCLEHNFSYFTIIGDRDLSSTVYVPTGGVSQTTGSITPYGTYTATTVSSPTVMPIFKPGSQVTIRCFTAPPGGHAGKIEDARQVRLQLRAKYKLKDG